MLLLLNTAMFVPLLEFVVSLSDLCKNGVELRVLREQPFEFLILEVAFAVQQIVVPAV